MSEHCRELIPLFRIGSDPWLYLLGLLRIHDNWEIDGVRLVNTNGISLSIDVPDSSYFCYFEDKIIGIVPEDNSIIMTEINNLVNHIRRPELERFMVILKLSVSEVPTEEEDTSRGRNRSSVAGIRAGVRQQMMMSNFPPVASSGPSGGIMAPSGPLGTPPTSGSAVNPSQTFNVGSIAPPAPAPAPPPKSKWWTW